MVAKPLPVAITPERPPVPQVVVQHRIIRSRGGIGMGACLSYGGVEFLIHADPSVEIRRPESPYDRFLIEKTGVDAVDVQVIRGPFSAPQGMARICDNVGSWKIFAEQDQRVIFHHPPAFPEPLWRLDFSLQNQEVKLYCSEAFLMPGDDGSILNPLTYPLDILSMMYRLAASKSGFILHGGAACTDSGAILFSGESTAGKTTLSRLCLEAGLPILSDDRIIIRSDDPSAAQAWGTPWLGDPDIAINKSAPILGLCFLTQGDHSHLKPMSTSEAVRRLLPVTSIPWFDSEVTNTILSICEQSLARIPVHELVFLPDSTAVDALLTLA